MEQNKFPAIRFKKFTGYWEHRKLGDLGDFKSNGVDKLSKPNEIPVNLLNYMDVYNRRKLSNKIKSELMQVTAKQNQLTDNNVLKGDVFFTPTSETADDIGHCMVIEETLENTVYSYHLMRYRPHKNTFDLKYPNYAFDTKAVKNMMTLMAQGVQRFVLSKSQFENIEISYTNLEEQKKIADFLNNLDSLIVFNKYKCEKINNIRKSLLEKLLPQNKHQAPSIHFHGFSDAWEEHKFEDLYKFASEGGTPDTNNLSYYLDGKIPFVKIEDTEQKYIKETYSYINENGRKNSSAWIIPSNSVIFTNGATVGNVSINLVPVSTKQGILGIIPSDIITTEFLYYLLSSNKFQKEVKCRMATGTFATIILKNLNEISVFVPKNKTEQDKITNLLSNLDALLFFYEKKYKKLTNIKSALLEKMFA